MNWSRMFPFTLTLLAILFCQLLFSQNTPASDPRAVASASQAIIAITHGAPIADVTLEGSVVWGRTDTGTVTLKAMGSGESRVDYALNSGTRTEIRDAQTGIPLGQWRTPDGNSGRFAYHNCLTDPVWFFPALSSLSGEPGVVLSYVGQETRNGRTVQHIRTVQQMQGPASNANLQKLSTMDWYLDANTSLPIVVTFNVHPDNNARDDIPVEVSYTSYKTFSGVNFPTHISWRQQGNLLIDVHLTSASVNSGLTPSVFTIN